MEPIYTQTFTLTDLHVDRYRRLKPSVLLYFTQEVSGNHAALLGTDWETLAEKNLFWAIIRHRVQITRLPMAGETITLETWPMPTTRVAYPRATVAYDADGKELFKSVAIWVLMDTDTRAMILPSKSGVEVPGSVRGIEGALPSSISVKHPENRVCRTIGYSELDRNGHMNNTYYLNWTDDLLSSRFHAEHCLQGFNICYLAEGKEGQNVELFWQLNEENTLLVEAKSAGEDAHRIFAVTADYI